MVFTREIARNAFHGAAIRNYPLLRSSGTEETPELTNAINMVSQNFPAFRQFMETELSRWPLYERCFKRLIMARLQQDAVLKSDVLGKLLDDTNITEERLQRLWGSVTNLEDVTAGVNAPANQNAGETTDEIIQDLWNEVFVMDFLLHAPGLGFTNLEKVVRPSGQSIVDLLGEYQNYNYAIEITRIRERDFLGSTHPTEFDAIFIPENIDDLWCVLTDKLCKKNKQMRKFCAAEAQTYDKKLVVIKTSQWAYQDANSVVRDEIQFLLNTGRYTSIDEVLYIYDVENYHWIRRT